MEKVIFKTKAKNIECMVDYEKGGLWVSQIDCSNLLEKSVQTISEKVKEIIGINSKNGRHSEEVIRYFRTTGMDGKTYNTKHYSLDLFIELSNIKGRTDISNEFINWARVTVNSHTNKSLNLDIITFNDNGISIDVKVSPFEETVWLNQEELSLLFDTSRSNIAHHISNIFDDEELDKNSVCQYFSQTAKDGKTYEVMYYNLDMIISIGYRVNSKKGVTFRKWATSILREYLINGCIVDLDKCTSCQTNLLNLQANYYNVENRLKKVEEKIYNDPYQIIFEGEIVKPYTFLRHLFFMAKKRLIIGDNYADKFLLDMLTDVKIDIKIYTTYLAKINNLDIQDNIELVYTDKYHDRFIVIDDILYVIGSSFNDIGKKRFFISKLHDVDIDSFLKI